MNISPGAMQFLRLIGAGNQLAIALQAMVDEHPNDELAEEARSLVDDWREAASAIVQIPRKR